MPRSSFGKREDPCEEPQDLRVPLTSACEAHGQPRPGHAYAARRPGRGGSGEAVCVPLAATPTGETADRSLFLRGLGAAVGVIAFGGATGSLGGLFSPMASAAAAAKPTRGATRTGLWLGNAAGLTPAKALTYKDPGSGDPALLLRLANGTYVSFDAGCTHAVCTVAYDSRRHLLVCPCHGATFDPARRGAVLVGPAKDPLYPLPVRVDASGNVYYQDAPPGPRVNRLHTAALYTGQTGDDGGGDGGDDGGGDD